MVEEMTAEQLSKYKHSFKVFDANGDGKISVDELGTLMLSLGANISQSDLRNIMNDLDNNRNGYIDFDEFVALMLRKEKDGFQEEDIIEAFKMFDLDNNGYIDKDELKEIMIKLGDTMSDEEVQGMINDADRNGDGRIQYDEFVTLMFSDD